MPGEVDVESRHAGLVGIKAHETDEAAVFGDEAGHGLAARRAVQPVDLNHLRGENTLSHDGAGEIEGEWGEVLPVAAHHLAHADSGVGGKTGRGPSDEGQAVDLANGSAVREDPLDHLANGFHGGRRRSSGADELSHLDYELLPDEMVGEGARMKSSASSQDRLRLSFNRLEDGTGHSDVVDYQRLGVPCELRDGQELLVDRRGASVTCPFEVSVAVPTANQARAWRALFWVLVGAARCPGHLERCLTGRTLHGLDHRVLEVVPVSSGISYPARLGLVGDIVVEVSIDGWGDDVPWHPRRPEVGQAATQGIFKKRSWV